LKKVLVISYYWPPAGGISIIRPLKLIKYLKEYGWEPVLCTADNPHYPIEDDAALREVPRDLEIIKVPIREPYELYKAITKQKNKSALADVIQNAPKNTWSHKFSVWARGNFFIPDARCLWIAPVVKKLKKYIASNNIDAIITTGPPHSVNRIGTLLKKECGLPWLADFQDPWTQVDYYKHFRISSWADARHKRMEQEVFTKADLVTIVSPSWKRDLESIGARNVEVIPLGYDPVDFNTIEKLDEKFSITHLGLLGEDRNPLVLVEVLKELCVELKDFEDNLEFKLVGKVNSVLKSKVEELGMRAQCKFVDQLTRPEAINLMQSAQILLLLLNKAENVSGRIPGKLFEYIGANRPILCLGPKGTDVERIVTDIEAGVSIDYKNKDELKSYLLLKYQKYLDGTLILESKAKEKYTHREVSAKFATYLDKITQK
jgi:glycosyltransferase involved in cell wall biosynthesis